MATYTATAADSAAPVKYYINREGSRVVDFPIAAALSVGDVIQMLKVPNGACITGVTFCMAETPNSHAGAITVNVGDGNDTSAYAASVVLSASVVALTSIPSRGLGRSYSATDTIDFVVTVVSAAGASGSLRLVVKYTNDR